MKFAVISDVHANLVALEAVFADIDSRGVENVLCLGDVIGYGPEPKECLDVVRRRCSDFVLGNHEAALLRGGSDIEPMCKNGLQAIEYTRGLLGDGDIGWLREWPAVKTFFDGNVALAHGSYAAGDYWTYVDERDAVLAELKGLPKEIRLCLVGHSHVPLVYGHKRGLRGQLTDDMPLPAKERFIVNCGSVGQPRDGDCRASYGIFEFDKELGCFRFTLVRVFYDIAETGRRMEKAGLPGWLHQRLYCGE